MTDMQLSGSDNFSSLLIKFNNTVKYYLQSGYFSPFDDEVKMLKGFYENLSAKILKLKTNSSSMYIKQLYVDYCSIRRMLACSAFKGLQQGVGNVYHQTASNFGFRFQQIYRLYLECLHLLEKCDIAEQLHISSFNERNVLIGPLRNRSQLGICLKGNFYHVPAKQILHNVNDISYIAIYQSKNFYGSHAGIKYYGKVVSYILTQRCNITSIPKQSDEMYYCFTVDSWQSLSKPISSNGGGSPFSLTSLYLLLRAKDICELYFTDLGVHKLYCSIRKSVEQGLDKVACNYRNLTFVIKDRHIYAYKENKLHVSVSFQSFQSNPGGSFWRLMGSERKNDI